VLKAKIKERRGRKEEIIVVTLIKSQAEIIMEWTTPPTTNYGVLTSL